MSRRPAAPRLVVGAALFVALSLLRTRGVSEHFWLLEDQIRDWSIALRPLTGLPLVGPPTHVGGYTIGPAFYWILWIIRVVVGPWFQHLPHAGGIGQALVQSAADVLLLAAVWHRTQSPWLALTTIVLVATAPFDLSLSALIWNPMMGSALAKAATALVLMDWPDRSRAGVALTAAVAWSAVQAYTGAIFVALGVFAALLVAPLAKAGRRAGARNMVIVAVVVLVLQVPYVVHQVSGGFGDSGMGSVAGSIARVVSGADRLRLRASVAGYVHAVDYIEAVPSSFSLAWVLALCGVLVGLKYRGDAALLAVTLLPQMLAIIGYAFWLDDLDSYFYLSLMPAAVLTLLLGATALLPQRAARLVAMALLAGALTLVPARLRVAAGMFRMPQYASLVRGSRQMVRHGQPVQAIETEFVLPPTGDSEFIYTTLGGRIDRTSPWVGVIASDGRVTYRRVGGP